MKFSTITVSASVLVATSLVSAAPHFPPSTRGRFSPPFRGAPQRATASVGAAFFMTNEANGNFIVASDIGRNGKLTFSRAVSAGGRGQHGLVDADGPDGLFSQGALKVSGNHLFVVNPGSNTASMFAIDPNQPSNIKMVGSPVGTDGQFPMSVAINDKTGQVCVLNGGEINGVSCFTADPKLGLIPVPNTVRDLGLNQTTPATGPALSASHVLFSGDGSKLIASVKGAPPANAGFIAVWDVAADGSLSPDFNAITPAKGGLLPFGMATLPGNDNALFVTDAGIGFDIFDLSASLTAETNGTTLIASDAGQNVVAAGLSSANAVGAQVAVCWAAFSPKTGNFFVTDIGTATVTEVNVDPKSLKSTIVKQYPQTPGSATIDDAVGTIGGSDFLYVLAANTTSINVLSLSAPGKAKTIQTLNVAQGMRNAKVTINPNNVQGMTVFIRK